MAPNPGPMTLEGTNTYLYGSDPCAVIDPGPDDAGHLEAVCARRRGAGRDRPRPAHPLPRRPRRRARGAARSAEVRPCPCRRRGARRPARARHPRPRRRPRLPADRRRGLLQRRPRARRGLDLRPARRRLARRLHGLAAPLQAEPIELICPGHGPWITDPAAKLAEYVEHREMRERRLLAALERGERSRAALLAEAWDDVPAELRAAAAMVMEAHLEKLEAERAPADRRRSVTAPDAASGWPASRLWSGDACGVRCTGRDWRSALAGHRARRRRASPPPGTGWRGGRCRRQKGTIELDGPRRPGQRSARPLGRAAHRGRQRPTTSGSPRASATARTGSGRWTSTAASSRAGSPRWPGRRGCRSTG